MHRTHEHRIHGFTFHALGGAGRLRLAGVAEAEACAAVVEAVQWLREAEAKFSRFRETSLVSRLNHGDAVPADEDLSSLLHAAEVAHRRTNGRLDVTALPLWRLWHDPHRVAWPSEEEVAAALRLRGVHDIVRSCGEMRLARPRMALDFGGIGKEWCVDEVVSRLESRGLRHFLVELSGDVAARGCQSEIYDGWWVLLPGCARVCLLQDAALATSGHGDRFRRLEGRRVSHLIDAQTGWPASGRIRSATVLAASCVVAGIAASDAALADGVDTAFTRLRGLPGMARTSDGALFMDDGLSRRCAELRGHSPIKPGHEPPTCHSVVA